MDVNLNNEIQDAGVVLVVAKKYQSELTAVGSTEAETRQLEDLVASLTAKDVAHETAVSTVGQLTKAQNDLFERGDEVIGKLKSVVKVAYYRDKVMHKTFHIGIKPQSTVAGMLAELAYLKDLVTANAATLAARGFGETDIAEITACYDGLQAKDAEQENVKKVRNGLRIERDALLKEMLDAKRKIRGSAAICFRNNPTILNEFKSIIRKSTTKKSTGDTESETAPDTSAGS